MRQKFLVELKNFHAKEIFHKGRLADDLSLKIYFDDHTFHTSEKHSGSDGEAIWSFHKHFVYKVPVGELNHLHLEGRVLRIVVWQAHRGQYGETTVDLYTLATGPLDHDLPIIGADKHVVGRLAFTVVMEHFTEVVATFQFIKITNLFPLPGHQRTHAYLRYGHSTTWRQNGYFEESRVYDDTENPEWWDLVPVDFVTSWARFVKESIDIAVCHHGTWTDGEYGHCNLIFVKPGKNMMTEGKESHFQGPLKYGNCKIEGKVVVTGLPKYGQMIPTSSLKKSIHTENGIYDSQPLLIGLPLPKCPIIETGEKVSEPQKDEHDNMHQVPPLAEEIHKEIHEDFAPKDQPKLAQTKEFSSSHDSQKSNSSHASKGSSKSEHKHHHKHNNNEQEKAAKEPLTQEKAEPTQDNLIDFATPPQTQKEAIMSKYSSDPNGSYVPFWKNASNNYVHL
mmetsp:Transcript_15371/g.21432  ORF Transcript_15371/g.21432 Transcript_15371/m.21432 type:complete len:449 (+) Transcript_15371:56-1402(+)